MTKSGDGGTLFLKKVSERTSKPRMTGEACIVLLHPPGPEIGRRVPLSRDEYVVGRVPENDIVIERDSVSRRHARLLRDDAEGWLLEDMDSTNGSFVNDVRIRRKRLQDGDQLRIGDTIYKFLVGTNIEAAYHEEIYRMTILDGLTGVHNKRYFLDFLERELASAERHGHPLALVLFDIDHFKQINDRRGHLAGDAVLKELAERVKARIRREDLFARYGGEEFAVILTQTALEGGVHFAEDLRALIGGTPFTHDGESIEVTVSLGVACVQGERDLGPLALIKRADEKLYEAKNNGRDRVAG